MVRINMTSVENRICIEVTSNVLQSMMKKAGLSSECLMQSVIISRGLARLKVPHLVMAGYLVYSGRYAIRHVWVHVFPMETVDLLRRMVPSLSESTYARVLPEGCSVLEEDVNDELEEMLDRVCITVGSTKSVVDYPTVLTEYMRVQPLWMDIVDVMC